MFGTPIVTESRPCRLIRIPFAVLTPSYLPGRLLDRGGSRGNGAGTTPRSFPTSRNFRGRIVVGTPAGIQGEEAGNGDGRADGRELQLDGDRRRTRAGRF